MYTNGVVSYLCYVETLSIKCTVFEIFDCQNAVLGIRQRDWKCHHVIERM